METHALIDKAKQYILEHNSQSMTAYLLERTDEIPDEQDINRTLGHPIGVSDENWPRSQGRKMFHVLTLEVASVPALSNKLGPEIKAIAFFISSLINNKAYAPDNEECALIGLSAADLALGVNPASPEAEGDWDGPQPSRFVCREILLPAEIFEGDLFFERDERLQQLANALLSQSYAGGLPLWLQSKEYEGEFLFQFDEDFIYMNLGDAGVMYVFKETSFWQCC